MLCDDYDLIDSYRFLHPSVICTTWTGNNVSCLLDRILISKSLLPYLHTASISPCSFSDHCFVNVSLVNIPSFKMGPGYWHCNVSVLKDPDLRSDILDIWSIMHATADYSHDWWEECKGVFKDLIILHSKRLSLNRNFVLNDLRKSLFELSHTSPDSPLINDLKLQVNDLMNLYNEGVKIRAKVRNFNFDDKCTKFFFDQVKSKGKKKFIDKISVNGTLINDTKEIINETKSFYSSLFTEEPVCDSQVNFFLSDCNTLSSDQSDSLEGPIALDEVRAALRGMKDLSSPGSDGLPKEFYLSFLDIIGEDYVIYINKCFDQFLLSPSQRLSYITLICKDPEQSENLKFWRPISLLNVDYKIISKILCNRLSSVMSSLVHIDQTCSVPSRSILDNCHLLRNILNYVDQNKHAGILLFIDNEKAFDRVSHQYLFKLLQAYNFGSDFRKWIELLYFQSNASVMVNGFISDSFQLERGVHQGCALSPLLYVLALEPLLNKIRSSHLIQGLKIPGSKNFVKCSAYADDLTCILSSEFSLFNVLKLCQLFDKASGSRLNMLKTKAMWIGSWADRTDTPCGIAWVSELHRALGIHIGYGNTSNYNWTILLNKFKSCLNLWRFRNLSFQGRSVLLHTLALSKLWYVGSVLPAPNLFVRQFCQLQFKFFWNSDHECLKREVLYNDVENGGFKLVNIIVKLNSLNVMHVKRLLSLYGSSECPNWCYYAVYWLGYSMRQYDERMASNLLLHSPVMPLFYRNVLCVFRKFVELSPDFDLINLTTKSVYCVLIREVIMQPPIMTVFPNIDFKQLWRNINNCILQNNVKNFLFKLSHRILYTGDYLQKICQEKNCMKCLFCNSVGETPLHLFFTCNFVRPLWINVEKLLQHVFGEPVSMTLFVVLWNNFTKSSNIYCNNLFIYFVSELKWTVWKCRNEVKHHKRSFTVQDLYTIFISSVKSRIKLDFRRMPSATFENQWCINNVLCEVNEENLLLKLST